MSGAAINDYFRNKLINCLDYKLLGKSKKMFVFTQNKKNAANPQKLEARNKEYLAFLLENQLKQFIDYPSELSQSHLNPY